MAYVHTCVQNKIGFFFIIIIKQEKLKPIYIFCVGTDCIASKAQRIMGKKCVENDLNQYNGKAEKHTGSLVAERPMARLFNLLTTCIFADFPFPFLTDKNYGG